MRQREHTIGSWSEAICSKRFRSHKAQTDPLILEQD